ncbi:MAG: hypothetical protein AABN95_09190 [Acidobacteriota bacterium]
MVNEEVLWVLKKLCDFLDWINSGGRDVRASRVNTGIITAPLKGSTHAEDVVADGIARSEVRSYNSDAMKGKSHVSAAVQYDLRLATTEPSAGAPDAEGGVKLAFATNQLTLLFLVLLTLSSKSASCIRRYRARFCN